MAHNIQPETFYQIVSVQIAVRCDNAAEACDAINELLNNNIADDTCIADWKIAADTAPAFSTNDPEEGELFND